MASDKDNGWPEYQRLVLAELSRLDGNVQQVKKDVEHIRLTVAVLRTKAISWGAAGGLVMWGASLAFTYWAR
tara:strand:- start:439 stop:654 length:216 start_codon:yes stop_codon:yes gene_type:complete